MAKDMAEIVKNKVKDGWIKAWMAIEVLAVTEGAAETSLKKHVERMEKEDAAIIYRKEFKKSDRADNPFKKGGKAYSKVVEVELVARRFEDLVFMVMNYAPSSIEILEPGQIKLDMGQAQGILNSISELIHKFAMASSGVIAIDT